MNRIHTLFSIVVAVVLAISVTGSVLSQTTLGGDVKPGRALRLTITGDMVLNLVDRSDSFGRAGLSAAGGSGDDPLLLGGSWPGDLAGGSFFDPLVRIGIDAAISEGVTASLRLETPFDINSNGRDGNLPLSLGEAKVSWEGAMDAALDLEFGVVDYVIDFSGNGQPFLLDLGNAESAYGNGGGDSGSPQSASAGRVQSLQAVGGVGHYDLGENTLDVLMFDLSPVDNESLFGLIYGLPLDTGDYSGDLGLVILNSKNDGGSDLLTLGGGGQLSGDDGLKFYGEIYWQFGDYSSSVSQSSAYGLVAGVHYDIPETDENDAPWVDISLWDLSGDDNGANSSNTNFVSYEFNNDMLVLEDAYYGLDVDTNYRAFKIKGGMNLSPEWSVQGLFAFATLNANNNGAVSNGSSSSKLGDEFDFRATYRATDYLTFYIDAGTLQNAKALGVGSGVEVITFSSEVRF
ncbi:MAG: alginate export family protein [Planctomycetota bacterium]|nr:alginate export family protein [Planctomycetota bacterium]